MAGVDWHFDCCPVFDESLNIMKHEDRSTFKQMGGSFPFPVPALFFSLQALGYATWNYRLALS